jgi:hypothetical protein
MVGLAFAEDIANSTQGLDERIASGRIDLSAESVDVDIHDIGVGLDAHAPDLGEEHGPGDDPTSMSAKILQERKLLRTEVKDLTGASGSPPDEIKLDIEDAEARRIFLRGLAAADEISQAREQLCNGEGLGEVVVATLFEATNAIIDGATCGEDEHGSRHTGAAEIKDEIDSVAVG